MKGTNSMLICMIFSDERLLEQIIIDDPKPFEVHEEGFEERKE